MRFKFLFILLIAVQCFSQSPAEPPRLVVGIMIDGMQQKHLDMLWSYFDPGGFKRIFEKGSSFRNVSYNTVSAGAVSDIATVMSGSFPYFHGITGQYIYNKTSDKIQQPIDDEQEIGIGTTERYSAYNLLSSTITDELSLANVLRSKVHAVGINAANAIMLGGHTANSVSWIDDVKHQWVATGYYKDGLCKSAYYMNANGNFKQISQAEWKPLYAINTYLSSAKETKKTDFSIRPNEPKNKNTSETWLKNTPAANALVADLAARIVTDEQLGSDNITDMLMLEFSVRTPNEKIFSLQSVEKEDMYLRLDRELQALLQKIDSKVGLDQTLVFLYSNQTDMHSPTELGENNIPAGYFNANRSMALLNTYLMALYGQEKWIKAYYGKNIYLNKQKIEEKKISFSEIQQAVANFMPEFEGIQNAYTSQQITAVGGDTNPELLRIRNSYHNNTMGDVIINLMPGWLELDNDMRPVGESNVLTSTTALAFYGWKIKPKVSFQSYQVTDIAPTLSRLLNIALPNASIGKPINEIFD